MFWMRRLNDVEMLIFFDLIYESNVILIKILREFFMDFDKIILKFIRKENV